MGSLRECCPWRQRVGHRSGHCEPLVGGGGCSQGEALDQGSSAGPRGRVQFALRQRCCHRHQHHGETAFESVALELADLRSCRRSFPAWVRGEPQEAQANRLDWEFDAGPGQEGAGERGKERGKRVGLVGSNADARSFAAVWLLKACRHLPTNWSSPDTHRRKCAPKNAFLGHFD